MANSHMKICHFISHLENANQIKIIPLVDNAEFTYIEEEYSFGKVNDSTEGTLFLAMLGANDTETNFEITNAGVSESMDIRTPSTTTISYGDAIILHADVQNMPEGTTIKWTASNNNFNFDVRENGASCKITPAKSGDTTFTATAYDANGNVISEDTQKMISKAGFFDKIIAFFKGLFGLTKTIPEMFK